MSTIELPRLYGPSFRKVLLPSALLLTIAWIILLGKGYPVPNWLQALALALWVGTTGSRTANDGSGNLLRQALAFAGQLISVIMLVLFIVFEVLGKDGLDLNGHHLLLLSLLFCTIAEVTYAFAQRETLGWRWLVSFLPLLMWGLLAALLLKR